MSEKAITMDDEFFKIDIKEYSNQNLAIEGNFTVITPDDVSSKYSINIEATQINKIIDLELINLSTNVKLKGFRPGKVPMSIIKQQYFPQAMNNAFDKIVREIVPYFIKAQNIKAVTEPKITITKFDEKIFCADIVFEIHPNIELKDFKNIEIEKPTFTIEGKDIASDIDKFLDQNTDFEKTDDSYAAQDRDMVIIDFVGKIENEEFKGGSAKDYKLIIGNKMFIDNFEEQLIGIKKEEKRDIEVAFPQTYHVKKLAGRNAKFAVTVNDIQKAKKMAKNDETAKKIGFDNFKAFEEFVSNSLNQKYDNIVKHIMKKELLDKLDAEYNIELPKTLFEQEYIAVSNSLKHDHSKEQEKQPKLVDLATRRLKLALIFSHFAEEEKISISDQELNSFFDQMQNSMTEQEKQNMSTYRNDPQKAAYIRGTLFEDKVVNNILARVKQRKKPFNLADLDKINSELN